MTYLLAHFAQWHILLVPPAAGALAPHAGRGPGAAEPRSASAVQCREIQPGGPGRLARPQGDAGFSGRRRVVGEYAGHRCWPGQASLPMNWRRVQCPGRNSAVHTDVTGPRELLVRCGSRPSTRTPAESSPYIVWPQVDW